MPAHTVTQVYQTGAESFSAVETFTDDTELNIDATLANATPGTWTGAITVANLKCLVLNTTGAVTIRATNGSGTILFGGSQLSANVTQIYNTQALAAAALGGSDITALHFTATSSGAVVKIRAILNQGIA